MKIKEERDLWFTYLKSKPAERPTGLAMQQEIKESLEEKNSMNSIVLPES